MESTKYNGQVPSGRLETASRDLLESLKKTSRIILFGVLATSGCSTGSGGSNERVSLTGNGIQIIASSSESESPPVHEKGPEEISPPMNVPPPLERIFEQEINPSLLNVMMPPPLRSSVSASFPHMMNHQAALGSFGFTSSQDQKEPERASSNTSHSEESISEDMVVFDVEKTASLPDENTPVLLEEIVPLQKTQKKPYTMDDLKMVEDYSPLAGLIALFGSLSALAIALVGHERLQAGKNQKTLNDLARSEHRRL